MLRDLRHAVRVLVQAKGWTAVVLVSLALGIGANTALFSAINGQLLRTIAADDPESLVRLSWHGENQMVRSHSEYGFSGETGGGERRSSTFSYPTYERLRESNETLVDMLAAAPFGRVNVIIDGQAEIASSFMASGSYFGVLGIGAAAGRTVVETDDVRGAPPAVMISHRFWNSRFGGARDAIGKVVSINNLPCTIVGVTPRDYDGIQGDGDDPADFHLPLALYPDLSGEDDLERATTWWLEIMGRLKPGVTAAQVHGNLAGVFQASAREGMTSYLDGLSAEDRALSRNQGQTAVPQLYVDSGRRGVYDTNPDTRRDAWLLGAVVILVLLVVCANVANLLLSRATTRQQEIGVRLSLGATRARLVRQLVTENVFLATVGGGLGLLVAFWARRLLPFGQEAPLDWKVFTFVGVLSVLTGVVFSVVPALRATAIGLSASLKENSRSVRGSRSLLSRGLLVVQVAVSLVLLMGAGLFLGTLRNLRSVDVGFDPTNILLFRLDPTLNGYEEERIPLFYDEVRQRLEAVGGVESVSLSRTTFLSGSTWISTVHFPGQDGDGGGAHMMTVSPEFFDTLQLPQLAGRVFDDRDTADSQAVGVFNAAAVREFLDGKDALGQKFGFSPETRSDIEIVGVVRDAKYASVREDAPPTVFLPYMQRDFGRMTFELKTAGDPRALVPTVRDIVRGIDANVPVTDVSTQAEQIEGRFRQERYFAMSYSMFGGLAMLLAAIGLFGLASYSVAQRTNEIGIRMALGAQRGDVVRMILRESLLLVGIGIGLGIAATLAAGRLVASLLYGVAATDVLTLAVAAVVMIGVSAIAGYLPARRASRVDPLVALQYE